MTEERTTTTIPFELISTYGASLPIMPNMLAELMGIQPGIYIASTTGRMGIATSGSAQST